MINKIVNIPWFEYNQKTGKTKRAANLIGKIIRIDGEYHYVKVFNNEKYDVLELYENEFSVII